MAICIYSVIESLNCFGILRLGGTLSFMEREGHFLSYGFLIEKETFSLEGFLASTDTSSYGGFLASTDSFFSSVLLLFFDALFKGGTFYLLGIFILTDAFIH